MTHNDVSRVDPVPAVDKARSADFPVHPSSCSDHGSGPASDAPAPPQCICISGRDDYGLHHSTGCPRFRSPAQEATPPRQVSALAELQREASNVATMLTEEHHNPRWSHISTDTPSAFSRLAFHLREAVRVSNLRAAPTPEASAPREAPDGWEYDERRCRWCGGVAIVVPRPKGYALPGRVFACQSRDCTEYGAPAPGYSFNAAPAREASSADTMHDYCAFCYHAKPCGNAECGAREASSAPGEPLTDLERFDATNSARIVGQRGGTVPAGQWTTLILRYEATLRGAERDSSAPEPTLAGTHEETVVREVVKALTKTGYPRLADHLRATVAALTAERTALQRQLHQQD